MTYDRPYKIPVILEIPNLSLEDREKLFKAFEEHRPQELTYPSQFALDVCKQMAARGWPSLARPLPLHIAPPECVQIFAQCLKQFNQHASIRRTPDTSVLKKNIETTADFEKLVDDLTGQQDDITLSQIFQTDKARTNVFWTERGTPVNSKLSDNVIRVARLGETEKDADKRLKSLLKQVSSCIESARELNTVTFKETGTTEFRYK